jgi:ABC-type antimicrobial peptide transport system permease subunit
VGTALAVVCSRLLQSLLIGLAPVDPIAFGGAIALLGSIMIAAAAIPARRAAQLDPMRALRAE